MSGDLGSIVIIWAHLDPSQRVYVLVFYEKKSMKCIPQGYSD